jgi:hypothetical protein
MRFHRIVTRSRDRMPVWVLVAIYGGFTAVVTYVLIPALFGSLG